MIKSRGGVSVVPDFWHGTVCKAQRQNKDAKSRQKASQRSMWVCAYKTTGKKMTEECKCLDLGSDPIKGL
ncbi:hypothetical protein RA28_03670 [Ruegeria sp. ANG-S4]|nr:hypothetical protein RA28_03670 [Ruegeria sp. ANG-S4]